MTQGKLRFLTYFFSKFWAQKLKKIDTVARYRDNFKLSIEIKKGDRIATNFGQICQNRTNSGHVFHVRA